MGIGKLILYSDSSKPSISETGALIDSLEEMGLIGGPLDTKENKFFTGERFLQLISFMGCSANVCLAPKRDHDSGFCHLTIRGPLQKPQLFLDENCRPPRCPACQKTASNWQENIDDQTLKCAQCGNMTRLEDISWGRRAGYGRIFIEISNIFPGEAQPVPELLASLGRVTGTDWSYFFTG